MRVTTSRLRLGATPQRVFAALTEPALVRRWQYGSELTTDWRVGSPIRFRAEWQGAVLEQWGSVLEFDPPRRVRYSLFAPRPGLEDRPEHYFVMSYLLEDLGGACELTIVQEDPRPDSGTEAAEGGEGGEEDPVLAALRALVETAE